MGFGLCHMGPGSGLCKTIAPAYDRVRVRVVLGLLGGEVLARGYT